MGREADNWATPDTAPEAPNSGANVKRRPASLGSQADLWTTPSTSEANGTGPHGDGGADLRTQVSLWSTPDANASSYAGEWANRPNLREQAALWSTPNASEGEHGGPNRRIGSKGDPGLSMQAHQHGHHDPTTERDGSASSSDGPSLPRRYLNPRFVEWLMGWEPGWVSLAPLNSASSETGSYPPRPSERTESWTGN